GPGGAGPPVPDAPATAPPGAHAPPDTTPLRAAPERREMALVLGLVFVLYMVAGTLLQMANLRWGLLLSQILFLVGPVVLAVRWFYLDGRAVLPLARPAWEAMTGAALGAIALNHFLN